MPSWTNRGRKLSVWLRRHGPNIEAERIAEPTEELEAGSLTHDRPKREAERLAQEARAEEEVRIEVKRVAELDRQRKEAERLAQEAGAEEEVRIEVKRVAELDRTEAGS